MAATVAPARDLAEYISNPASGPAGIIVSKQHTLYRKFNAVPLQENFISVVLNAYSKNMPLIELECPEMKW
jgi:hypothetical protein